MKLEAGCIEFWQFTITSRKVKVFLSSFWYLIKQLFHSRLLDRSLGQGKSIRCFSSGLFQKGGRRFLLFTIFYLLEYYESQATITFTGGADTHSTCYNCMWKPSYNRLNINCCVYIKKMVNVVFWLQLTLRTKCLIFQARRLTYSFHMEEYFQKINDQMSLRVECTFFERQLTQHKGLY